MELGRVGVGERERLLRAAVREQRARERSRDPVARRPVLERRLQAPDLRAVGESPLRTGQLEQQLGLLVADALAGGPAQQPRRLLGPAAVQRSCSAARRSVSTTHGSALGSLRSR